MMMQIAATSIAHVVFVIPLKKRSTDKSSTIVSINDDLALVYHPVHCFYSTVDGSIDIVIPGTTGIAKKPPTRRAS